MIFFQHLQFVKDVPKDKLNYLDIMQLASLFNRLLHRSHETLLLMLSNRNWVVLFHVFQTTEQNFELIQM